MTGTILERLNERIAVEPALDNLDTLLADLKDARDAIVAAEELSERWKETAATAEAEAAKAAATAAAAPQPLDMSSSLADVHTLLLEAKERLSVHALSTVDEYLDRAIKILEG